jgi:hypothetical protein
MKVIDYDPAKKVPPLMERDINDKIITLTLLSPTKVLFLSYLEKTTRFQFRGVCFGNIDNIDYIDTRTYNNSVVWSDGSNYGKTIIELLINMYKYYSEISWMVAFNILESEKDLQDFMTSYNLHETPFGSELLSRWEQVAK